MTLITCGPFFALVREASTAALFAGSVSFSPDGATKTTRADARLGCHLDPSRSSARWYPWGRWADRPRPDGTSPGTPPGSRARRPSGLRATDGGAHLFDPESGARLGDWALRRRRRAVEGTRVISSCHGCRGGVPSPRV